MDAFLVSTAIVALAEIDQRQRPVVVGEHAVIAPAGVDLQPVDADVVYRLARGAHRGGIADLD